MGIDLSRIPELPDEMVFHHHLIYLPVGGVPRSTTSLLCVKCRERVPISELVDENGDVLDTVDITRHKEGPTV